MCKISLDGEIGVLAPIALNMSQNMIVLEFELKVSFVSMDTNSVIADASDIHVEVY